MQYQGNVYLFLLTTLVCDQPNLNPPITTVPQALAYRKALLAIDPNVTYLMTLYLHPSITPQVSHPISLTLS